MGSLDALSLTYSQRPFLSRLSSLPIPFQSYTENWDLATIIHWRSTVPRCIPGNINRQDSLVSRRTVTALDWYDFGSNQLCLQRTVGIVGHDHGSTLSLHNRTMEIEISSASVIANVKCNPNTTANNFSRGMLMGVKGATRVFDTIMLTSSKCSILGS